MSSLRKAAVLLMSLPQEEAATLLTSLDQALVEQVSLEIARIKSVSAEEQEQTILEFAECNPSTVGSEGGGLSFAEALLEKALGGKAGGAISSLRHQIESLPFGFLRTVDAQNILTYILDEHPQTIALVLSHLPAGFAAEILAGLPTEQQISVVRRIANMGQTSPDIIKEVEAGLERRMSNVMSQDFRSAGGIDSVAEMLNVAERSTERAIMENLAQDDPDLVEEIRRRMFIFEDITKFADPDIQKLLKNVESAQWALALKGASQELCDKILGNMSERAGTMLKEEMDYLGAVKLSAVEKMQQQIVDVVRGLEDAGEIEISSAGEQEQMVG
jgi:flagellar motor switch protein FliG